MIVAIGNFMGANWKVLSVAATLLASGGGAVYGHVEGADSRFDALEIQAVRDSAAFDGVRQDVSEIRCMAIQNAQDEDPLECLE